MANKLASDFQIHGLFAHYWAESRNSLPTFHRHNEIEINFLGRGKLVYTIGGRSARMPVNTLFVFWAGFSHRMAEWEDGEIWALSIPLTAFLTWPLPHENFVHRLLHGEIITESDPSRTPFDADCMKRWHADLNSPARAGRQDLVLLEVQGRLRRLAMNVSPGTPSIEPSAAADRVAEMLQFIAEHYCEDLTVAAIAKSADTNVSYAMEIFKQSCGMSIMQYVNDQRVTHARRMLATTDAKILDVAMESGFGSVSQFYNVFRQVCGQTPRHYAQTYLHAKGNGTKRRH